MSRKAAQVARLPTLPIEAPDQPPVKADAAPVSKPESVPSPAPAAIADGEFQVIEADVDGRRVRIVAKDEIVFECGQASVTLRRNGRIIIRGTYVETHSEGTNRIKGGQVRIN
jgi:hypothetical protein